MPAMTQKEFETACDSLILCEYSPSTRSFSLNLLCGCLFKNSQELVSSAGKRSTGFVPFACAKSTAEAICLCRQMAREMGGSLDFDIYQIDELNMKWTDPDEPVEVPF